jgi:ABC-2 type transport system permease protein
MIIFLLVGVSFGLMISAVADSQEFAFMISVFTTVLPTLLLSGFVFPIRNMPKAIQLFSYLVPARYFMDIIRGIIIKGTGFFSFWLEFVILTIIAVFLLFVSSQKLKRKLS